MTDTWQIAGPSAGLHLLLGTAERGSGLAVGLQTADGDQGKTRQTINLLI